MASKLVKHIRARAAALRGYHFYKKRPPLPRQLEPRALELGYFSEISALLLRVKNLIYHEVTARLDSLTEATISEAIRRIRSQTSHELIRAHIKRMVTEYARRVEIFQIHELNKQLVAGLGFLPDPKAFKRDAKLTKEQRILKGFIKENVALIESIPDQELSQVEHLVYRSFRSGVRADKLAEDIERRHEVATSRAMLIARDQIGKLNGNLNQLKQEGLGITSYVWRTSLDERVRGNPSGLYPKADPSHWDREGESFSWNDPPEDGHPGAPIQCRCHAEPDLSPLIEEE